MRNVSPSLLSADFADLGAQIASVEKAGSTRLHLDVMDGNFVPNITFGPLIIEAIHRLTEQTLDVHLMIAEPQRYLKQFIAAGADVLIIHYEASTDIKGDLAEIKRLGAVPGIAINPDSNFDVLRPYIGLFDYFLVMSVFPGFGGQSFNTSTLDTMRAAVEATKDYPFLVAVDGGVNMQTIDEVFATGIDIGVVGSGLFKADDIPARLAQLQGAD